MPPLRETCYHMTFTDTNGLTLIQLNLIESWLNKKTSSCCAVIEKGNNGNTHVHAYAEFAKPKVTTNLRKSCKKIYDITPTRIQLMIKKVDSKEILIGSYFTKENDYEILVKTDDIDIEKCKVTAIDLLKQKKIKLNRICLVNAHNVIYSYSQKHGITINDREDFASTLCKMAKDGYPIHILAGKMLWIYSMYKCVYQDNDHELFERIMKDLENARVKEEIIARTC